LEALGRRLRRNYVWIYLILGIAWLAKVWLHPTPTDSWNELMSRAAVGSVPGEIMFAAGLVVNGFLILVALLTVGLQQASGEVLPRYGGFRLRGLAEQAPGARRRISDPQAWFRPSHRRQQLLAWIITDRAQAVADRILHEMNRGVTALPGTGMYTHATHTVLLCALTATEVPNLKALVRSEDQRAFMTLTPAQEVLGQGFVPLDAGEQARGARGKKTGSGNR
jgi:uncharacterized protein YaaQ